jgi:hypothetical protein
MGEHGEHQEQNQELNQDQQDTAGQHQEQQEQIQREKTTQETEHGSQQGSGQESQQTQAESQEPPAGTTSPSTLFGSDEMEGLKSEEQKKKEAEEAEKKKRQETAKQTGSQKTYPAGTEFRYSGHSKILEEEMSEAKIFEWVADDFPEIEKGRFTLRYDQNKGRLVPIPEAQKKGSGTSTLQVNTLPPGRDQGEDNPRPPVYRLLCADGVYEVRNNLSGTYVVRLESGLTLAEGYYPNVPKAPAKLLAEVVRIFAERPDTEALIDIVYDRRNGTFCLVWNQKQASAGEVDYQPLPDDDNFVLYAEIHSHHKMHSFFSTRDDHSEKPTGVYGVVGRVTDEVPEARFRYSCGGHFRELFAEDLFDDPSVVAATVRRPESGGLL